MIKLFDILKETLSINSANNVAEKFKNDFEAGKVSAMSDKIGGKNIGIYPYSSYIIKRVKPNRAFRQEDVDRLAQRVSGMERVIVPKAIITLKDGSQAIVMDKATGIGAEKLNDDQINKIPQEHWDNFLQDIKELSKRGIQTDLSKRSNFFYDSSKGFQLLDIEGASIDGDPTSKFFEKDGQQYYYSYEKYPFMPKKFTSSKEMFLKISKN
jgi:hypothetical protein